MKPLSNSQIEALKHLDKYNKFHGRFSTGESLRKLGYAERYTAYCIYAEYADKNGVNQQYKATAKNPHPVTDWYITAEGYEALCDWQKANG